MKINVDNTNIEYVNLQGKLELSIEHLSRAFTIQVEFPEFISENGINYFIYKNSIYADLIYIVPPEKSIVSVRICFVGSVKIVKRPSGNKIELLHFFISVRFTS